MRVALGMVAVIAAGVVGGASVPAAAVPARGELATQLDALTGPEGVAFAALAEVRQGGRVWRAASGQSTVDDIRRAPADGRFRMGSVTKTFTATMVLQLVGEGRLALSDSVRRWLPGLGVPGGETVTVADLLQHTSGIPGYAGDVVDSDGLPLQRWRTWSPAELVRIGLAHLTGPAAGGSPYHYSDTNYIVLGMLVEKVTGHSYRDEVRRRILAPLGLHDTEAPGSFPFLTGPHAHGYVPVTRDGTTTYVDITTVNPTVFGAAGDLISTTDDLNRFFRALLGGRLLRPAELTAMMTPRGPSGYGFGLETMTLSCGRVYGHTGQVPGYVTGSFHTADGSRQISLSLTLRRDAPPSVVAPILQAALCP